jgi:hypothetical protein
LPPRVSISAARRATAALSATFEELDDAKAAAGLHARIAHLESRHREAATHTPDHVHLPAAEAERPV